MDKLHNICLYLDAFQYTTAAVGSEYQNALQYKGTLKENELKYIDDTEIHNRNSSQTIYRIPNNHNLQLY